MTRHPWSIRRFAFLILPLAVGLGWSGQAAAQQFVNVLTGGTGGVYYPLGGGMAAVLSKYVQGMQATAEVTGGSVANLQLIGTGKPYLAMTMVDAGLDAYKGQDKFTGKPVPVLPVVSGDDGSGLWRRWLGLSSAIRRRFRRSTRVAHTTGVLVLRHGAYMGEDTPLLALRPGPRHRLFMGHGQGRDNRQALRLAACPIGMPSPARCGAQRRPITGVA